MSLSNAEEVSSPNSDFDPTQAAAAIWAAAQQALAEDLPEQFSDQAVQQLMTAAVKLFAAKLEKDDQFFCPLVGRGDLVTATEVVVTVSELMRAASLNPFDLAMWFNRRPS